MNHAIFAEVRVPPQVVDFSLIIDAAGVGAVGFTMLGAILRYDRDRLARGVYGTMWIAVIVMAVGAVRWEERSQRRR